MWKTVLLIILGWAATPTHGAEPKYQNDFEQAAAGSVPDEMLVLDGQFAVREEGGNKFLELPGSPLDTFGVLFGPAEKENVAVTARIFGSSKGRRFPVFEVGLHGVGGYKLRVSPGKKQIELFRGDSLKAAVPLEWRPGQWTYLKLQSLRAGDKEWKVEGKMWQEGGSEPAVPTISFVDDKAPTIGRASVAGMPHSGTPIRFDDLRVTASGKLTQ